MDPTAGQDYDAAMPKRTDHAPATASTAPLLPASLTDLAAAAGRAAARRGWTMATAESCTGGLVGALLTSVPGCSEWYVGGVVSYSNALKRDLLGVGTETLAAHGAVSAAVAEAMAVGARDRLGATIAVAVTGIAGPDGGSADKPVGLVWFALAGPSGVRTWSTRTDGDRQHVRAAAAATILAAVVEAAGQAR